MSLSDFEHVHVYCIRFDTHLLIYVSDSMTTQKIIKILKVTFLDLLQTFFVGVTFTKIAVCINTCYTINRKRTYHIATKIKC